MRIGRLLGVFLTMITVGLSGGLLLAPSAAAQPPLRLPGYVTDNANVLSESTRTTVSSAVIKLYGERRVRLWVVYVDSFSGQSPDNWARRTYEASNLGSYDVLLAVATTDRAYAFLVPNGVQGVSSSQVDNLRRNEIEPALSRGDWAGAAIVAANGLNVQPTPTNHVPLLIALGVIVFAVVLLLFVMRRRARRRHTDAVAAARQVDPTDATALAALPLDVLDDLSRSKVVEVDNAVRTSSNELALAVEEFGASRTAAFTQALDNAKAALSQAFTVRQQLDDSTPETAAQRREMLTRVIVSAATADNELDSQTEAFEQLRDLVINAPTLLDALTQQYIELTARIEPAEQHLRELNTEFGAAALASISGNVATARERLEFADRNISLGRELAGQAVAGQQSGLVDAVHSAESAVGQARSLLDAVDSAAGDIRHAVANLPSVLADTQAAIKRANEQLQKTKSNQSTHTGELIAARDAAARALDSSSGNRGTADPLSAFASLTRVDAELNHMLATVAQERANAERLNRSFEQALFTAESRVRAVSEYIDTRRGSIGPEARTRLAEASRQLEAARARKTSNLAEAIAYANGASTLAAQAQSAANADVQATQRAYTSRGDSNTGAVLGGIIIGDLLSGGLRGGFGGGPTSFGGSSSNSSGGSSGGGFMGGGGRF